MNAVFHTQLPFSFTSYAEVMCLIIICYVQASEHMICTYKVSGSIPDEVIFFLIYLILLAALGLGVYSASNRNGY
jgi:hypothetical protein